MMVLKKKEIIAAALVMLIGMAGYLNWSYQDTIQVKDGDSYVETGKKVGTAEFVADDGNAQTDISEETSEEILPEATETSKQTGDYFENAVLAKQTARSKALEILNQTAANESFDDEVRKQAQQKILEMASLTEKETVVENLARAKGYDKICVYVNENSVDISVQKDGFSEEDVVKIHEIARNQLNIPTKNIKVVEVK